MAVIEDFVKQELEAAGGDILYPDLLGRVMSEHPTQRMRLPPALRSLRSAGVLHETVTRDKDGGQIIHIIRAGKRPPDVVVDDG